ncbi:MAG: hypothetical protein RL660_2901 [Bacteroidota bacterium]|jgi:hypothetical protein
MIAFITNCLAQKGVNPTASNRATLIAPHDFVMMYGPTDKTTFSVLYSDGKRKESDKHIAYELRNKANLLLAKGYGPPMDAKLADTVAYSECTLVLTDTLENKTLICREIVIQRNNSNVLTLLPEKGRLAVQHILYDSDNKNSKRAEFKYKAAYQRYDQKDLSPLDKEAYVVPGDYKIVVYCTPLSIHSTNVGAYSTTVVEIPLPGLAEFSLDSTCSEVEIHTITYAGVSATACATVNISKPSIELQPGMYLAKWTNKNSKREQTCEFQMRSRRYTSIVLTQAAKGARFSADTERIYNMQQ